MFLVMRNSGREKVSKFPAPSCSPGIHVLTFSAMALTIPDLFELMPFDWSQYQNLSQCSTESTFIRAIKTKAISAFAPSASTHMFTWPTESVQNEVSLATPVCVNRGIDSLLKVVVFGTPYHFFKFHRARTRARTVSLSRQAYAARSFSISPREKLGYVAVCNTERFPTNPLEIIGLTI